MLQQIRNEWTDLIQNELKAFAAEKGVEIPSQIQVGKPPKAEQGDFAYPMFTFAKAFGMNPAQIAGEIKKRLEGWIAVFSRHCFMTGSLLKVIPTAEAMI